MENDDMTNLKVEIAVLSNEVKNLSNAVNKLEKKLETNDEEHRLNVVNWIKNNFVVILVGAVVIGHTFGIIP